MINKRHLIAVAVACIGVWAAAPLSAQAPDLASRVAALRAEAAVPAVAGALFSSEAITEIAVSGVRAN